MIKIVDNPNGEELKILLSRPFAENESVKQIAAAIIERVKNGGDAEVRKITFETDKVDICSPVVTAAEFAAARGRVSDTLRDAINKAKTNIEKFHAAQLHTAIEVTTTEGVTCYQKSRAISRIGLYIPGGTAPLFSTVLMLAVPAIIAGCREIILCSPPSAKGEIADEIIYCAELCGVDKIYKIGGATAIAAMAYGTESIAPCHKIFGPGNRYVTAAKQLVSLYTAAIDMPAGPSEVMVVCDESAKARYVAADLLSQAEHGADSQAIAITTSSKLATEIKSEVEKMVSELTRGELAELSLKNSAIVVVKSRSEIMNIVNSYAPEHLIVSLEDADTFTEGVENAGSIFIGNYTPESAGDYCSGTNHTLPTSGWAKSMSGVNLDSFSKKITYQKITKQGIENLAPIIIEMANAEGLTAHALAAKVRTEKE